MSLARLHFHIVFLFIVLFHSFYCCAQKTEVYYDMRWKPCPKEKATYYSVKQKTDSGYYQQDYFVNSGRPQMFALYEDSSSKIENGYSTHYYANGIPQHVGRFVHGQREGVAVSYHPNGIIADSGFYQNGQPTGSVFKWHTNGFISDSISRIKDSFFVHVSWFDDGSVASAGREINGKPHGPWVFYHPNGTKAAVEVYDTGKRINTRHFNEDGVEIPVDTSRNEHAAEFKGGVNKWRQYLERGLEWPNGYHFENTKSVVLMVQLTIDERGNITDVYIVNPFHPAFDKVAYDVIRKGPKWNVAIQHNRPVKYRFVQSVTFSEQ